MKPKFKLVWMLGLGLGLWQCTEDEDAITSPTLNTSVNFTPDRLTLPKASAPLKVNLTFSRATTTQGLVTVRLSGDAEYDQHFATTPEAQGQVVIIPVEKGQASAFFTISLLNDQDWSDNRQVHFTLESPSSGFTLGSKKTSSVKLENGDVRRK